MILPTFRSSARPVTRDLSDMATIPVVGITAPVRSSFKVIKDAVGIETLGFSFRQLGVTYRAFYKDESNNDRYHFEIDVPNSPHFVHRHTTIGILKKLISLEHSKN
jgi:hypothetical protein